MKSNDGSDLFIGGVRVVDNDRAVGYVEANGFVYLEKGCHPLKLRYFDGYSGEYLLMEWICPKQTYGETVSASCLLLNRNLVLSILAKIVCFYSLILGVFGSMNDYR